MAYRAEIEIGVKGQNKLEAFQKTLKETNKVLEIIDGYSDLFDAPVNNLKNYTKNLKEAAKALQLVEIGTKEETTAIRNYVQAAAEAATVRNRQNNLMDEEAQKLGLLSQKLREYNAAAAPARQVGSMTGAYLRPGEASLKGQASDASKELALAKNRLDVERGIGEVQESLRKLDQDSIRAHNARLDLQADYLTVLQRTADAAKFRTQQPVAQLALPAFQERGLQLLDDSVKANESQLRIEQALNGERARGVRFLEKQAQEEKRQLDLGITGQRTNLLPANALRQEQELAIAAAKRTEQLAVAQRVQRENLAVERRIRTVSASTVTQFNLKLNLLKQIAAIGRQIDESTKRELVNQRRINRELKVRKGRERQRRVKDSIGSGIIGGAFPLLFGQGAGASLGGLVGGVAGGLLGGPFGFGLSLVGTAAGTSADQLKEAASTIAEALDGTSASLEAVKEAGINVSDATINYVKELEEAGRAIDAYNAVQQELNSIYGTEGVRVLQELKEANNFANTEAGKLSAVLQTELAPVFILLAQLSGSVARGLRDFIPDLLNLIADYTIGVPGATAFNEVVGQTPRSNPALVAAGVREREAELAADAQVQSITATTEGLRRQAQINELNNDLTNKRVVALKRAGIESKANNKIEELSQEITADIFNTNLKRVNLAKIQQVEQQRIVDLAKLEADERKAIEAATARQTRELEKQAALQRKIRDAQISRQLAEDIFANQPAINATPFSRTTPEQDRESALQLQQIKYAAEIDKINNSITNEQLKQEALDTASARNQLARLNIERQYASTVKQNTENFLTLQSSLKNQLALQTATTREQAEQLRLQEEMEALSRTGTYTEAQLQDIRRLKEALIEAQGPLNQFLTDTERAINNLSDTEVQIVTAAQSIEREFSAAFQSVITGTTSVQQALSTMLANIGRDFIAMATQIIAKQLVMIALNRTLGIFGLFGGAGGGGFGVPVLTSGINFSGAFRNGGRPEPRKVAIVGENGPELFIPDGYGRIIPNGRYKINTGGIGGAPNTITVNVDARSTDVQGDDDKSRQLGTTISRVIQAELVRQQRPGGLLHGNR